MSKVLDFSAVPADLKRHTVKNPEILKQVFKADRSFFNYVQLVPNVLDRVVMNRLKISSIAQPGGTNSFNPLDDRIKPEPRYGYVKKNKIDLAFDEEDIDALWLSYLGELEARNPKSIADLPYEQVFIELILAQVKEDDHLSALYRGVRNEGSATPGAMYDGYLKLLADDITGGVIKANQIAITPAFTIGNTVENIEKVKSIVPDRFRMKDLVMVMSPTLKDWYEQDYRNTFGSNTYNTSYEKRYVDGTKIEMIAEEGLEGSSKVITTLRNNLKYMTAGTGDMSRLTFQEFERTIKIMGDWRSGVNYAFPEYIWLNDLA